jgi:myo-inositol 2-dehydrogenase / D-chiro-inositol 1-dehydrogenase
MKVAVVGTGGVANRHLGVLSRVPGCSTVGHVSTSLERARSQAVRWGGQAYDNVARMLECERPDAVWVCVTPDRHGPIEETLIARGVPFFVEKPLSNDLATAEHIAKRLDESPLVVGVGYKFRA